MNFIETTSTVTNTDLYSIQRERNPELKKIYELNQSFGKWMIYLVYRPVLPSLVNLHTVSCLATVLTSHQQSCLGGVINPDWVNILYCHLITS